MREIKFRAWHKKQMRMYSAEEMGKDQLTLMPNGRGFANIHSQATYLSQIDDNRTMIPLQFTGLKDKYEKEIYEGDIVVAEIPADELAEETGEWLEPIDAFIGVVIWEYGGFSIDSKGDGKEEIAMTAAYTYRVLGNIYENQNYFKSDNNP